ncbi:hypothetical protein BGZ76_010951 [Entomortierella beljakovae]|nr:hypothetical protein BGZ76_010951 [Entomortierella beljakovae]
MPIFTSADEPPPYSPTHTILPHYFSLEPIPVRSFIIKESTTVPYIYDFWLCTTPQSASPGLLFQERGLVQSPNELKYCIIRPQDTDRTAFPASGISAQNAYFTPALALVSANYPSRWIWWGTEALHMVVFGRQLKNIIMEWKWKHARLRIGGPIVHRLVGCSFSITPERKYCWKQGSGRRRPTETLGSRTEASRRNQGGQGQGQGQSSNSSRRSGQNTLTTISEIDNRAIRGGWLGSFFGRSGSNWNSSDTSNNTANNIQLDHIQISVPSTPALESSNTANSTAQPVIQSTEENPTLSEQEASADTLDNIEEDEEAGCYHCREECPSGITGRIVAVYKPGRPANRARDRPASSPKLEIYSELGERCETVMMLMCVRLDDLFMSIPDEKRGPFVPTSSGPNPGQGSTTGGSNRGAGGQNNQNAEGENSGASTVGDDRSEISALKRLLKRHHIWKVWVKWFIAAALISMVVVLVLRSKLSKSAK